MRFGIVASLVVLAVTGACGEESSSGCIAPREAWVDQCQAQVYADCGQQDCAFGYEGWVEQLECTALVDCVDPDLYEGCVGAIEQIEGCDPYPHEACEAMHTRTWQCQAW